MVSPTGETKVFAGSNSDAAIVDGGISKARFKYIWAIAADRQGNLYVFDDHYLRKIEKVE
ncbi:hypothetical protein [Williamwhitmania taraxaci]|uniref:Uncharacterized protein n=1 Tax=Williamwhitmania taraxaci TaxID=1640674 RepID=A0A1G6RSG9_9BACT|nr:hypothetical protein [Williamwhitmania taraxaci]SDD07602.1 hypothetical protein SAMN05216323_10802 [Williamwhitmania taraxaci]